jgi:hypothetical protein
MLEVKLDWAKDIAILLVWAITLFYLIRNEIRKKDRYATSESLDSIDERVKKIEKGRGMSPNAFAEQCKKCKEEWMMHEEEVKNDIKEIKSRLTSGDTLLTKLGVIQVAMCKHIKMPKEDIEMFKDAIYNGRELKRDI